MRSTHVDHAAGSRLRIVFNDTVVLFNLDAPMTLGEIARTLDQLPNERYGNPVAIDITLGSRGGRIDASAVVSRRG